MKTRPIIFNVKYNLDEEGWYLHKLNSKFCRFSSKLAVILPDILCSTDSLIAETILQISKHNRSNTLVSKGY